jgi:oligosaccharide repeat unit polymerase
VLNVLVETLHTRRVGKLLLIGSAFLYFWIEAVDVASESIPFEIPSPLRVLDFQFNVALVQRAYLYIALFQFMLLIGYSVRPKMRSLVSWVQSRVDSPTDYSRILRYVLAACAVLPLLLTFGFNIEDTRDALLAARSGQGPEAQQDIGMLHYLYFFGLYSAAFFTAEALVFRTRTKLWAFLVMGIIISPFVLWGVRHLWLFVAMPSLAAAAAIYLGRAEPASRAKWLGLAILLLIVLQLQFVLRDQGWKNIANIRPSQLAQADTIGQFTALLVAEYLVPDTHGYFHEPAEPYFLIHWIPRRFWHDKPIMRSWSFYNNAYTGGSPTFNVTPSIIGQFHMNWGIWGVVFIGLWLGFLTYLADRLFASLDLNRQKAMGVTVGILYAFIVVSFRFYSPVYFTYVVAATIGMFVLTRAQRSTRVVQEKNAHAVVGHPRVP